MDLTTTHSIKKILLSSSITRFICVDKDTTSGVASTIGLMTVTDVTWNGDVTVEKHKTGYDVTVVTVSCRVGVL